MVFFGYAFLAGKNGPPRTDEDTGCLVDHTPENETVVLVDNTDPYSAAQVATFKSHLAIVQKNVPAWGMLTIASVGGELPPTIVFSRCSPDKGNTFGILESIRRSGETPLDLRATYEREFQKPVNKLSEQMPLTRTTKYSPIIGSLEDTIGQIGSNWSGAHTRTLVIFSDLLENTKYFSQYGPGNNITFAQARSTIAYIRNAQIDLRNTDVTIYYLTGRDAGKHLQNRAHERFWREFIGSHGGHIRKWIALPM